MLRCLWKDWRCYALLSISRTLFQQCAVMHRHFALFTTLLRCIRDALHFIEKSAGDGVRQAQWHRAQEFLCENQCLRRKAPTNMVSG